jgi:hypothetical protein
MSVRLPLAFLLTVPVWLGAGAAGAAPGGEDDDLDRIPTGIGAAERAPPAGATGPGEARGSPAAGPARRTPHARVYLENALTVATRRESAVPFPPPPPFRWQDRISADLVAEWLAVPALKLTLSDRVDLVAQEQQTLWSRATARNELREAYASWQPWTRTYLELGRINVRNGVALGFSPTDFFRPRTLVGQASLDPSVLSRNRLGTLMVRAQAIGDRGAVSLLYAPKLYDPSPIGGDAAAGRMGIDTRLDATNAAHRALASASGSFGDLSAQAMVYLERRRSKLGLALTRPLGTSVVAYAEWAVGHEANLVARALEYGRQSGTLPPGATPPIPTDPSLAWRHDVAAGASWTIATRLTLNIEYHFHQGGLTGDDWSRWFATGRANALRGPELWYIRGYAADQLEPASQHNAFVRVAWPNAAIDNLEVDGFAFVNLRDGSTLTQVTGGYALSDRWTFTLSLSANLGDAQSERGSLPQAASAIAEIVCYL